jgi:hypothetical protein
LCRKDFTSLARETIISILVEGNQLTEKGKIYMKFKLYNFDRLTKEEVDFVNEHGHGSLPKHELSMRLGHGTSDRNRVEVLKMVGECFETGWFNHVANVTCDMMDDVFRLTNDPSVTEEEYNSCVERLLPMHSVSVGDVVENESGEKFLCDRFGWTRV